ncbi:hypothetical protein C1646_775512 [Rhizophagus diaphanus]|nr:hypothetical protein C1646_775512 [Rhizophagus diaphanus] [Rhizophagus sp. MUCL 43196]
MNFESAPSRTHENMQQVIRNEQKKDHSVHSTCNAFWKFLNLNIYEACIPDCMHHIDLGLLKISTGFHSTNFEGGNLGYLNVITAADYRNIMKIVLFALDDIFDGP